MKVAIIGAGVSGLSCAHELERYKIYSTIFERKSFIGDMESHVTADIKLMTKPTRNQIGQIQKKFNIKINPVNSINNITHHSPHKTAIIKGNLGYLLKRGRAEDSLLLQLYSQLNNTEVIFNEYADYQKIKDQFDYVVIANGSSNYTNELGCWQQRVDGWMRGAVVLGDFDPRKIIMWMNNKYSNKGYAYLTPFDEKKASIALFVPYVTEKEIDNYWELFLCMENIKYTIIEEFKVLHHSGLVYPLKVDNFYFVGTAGGAVDPFLGFGQIDSILQGVYAAQAIAKGKDYEELTKSIIKKTADLWEFRKVMDLANNKGYDKMLSVLGLPLVKQLIYEAPVNVFKFGAGFIRLKQKSNKH